MIRKLSVLVCCIFLCCSSFPVMAITEAQEKALTTNCDKIIESLKNVQRFDSRARVFLGSHYETMISKFIKPLNVKLLEDDMSDSALIKNQSAVVEAKAGFSEDYISYQQGLEDLVGTDCKEEPEVFYEKLKLVRKMRSKMVSDISEMRKLVNENVKLVERLKERL